MKRSVCLILVLLLASACAGRGPTEGETSDNATLPIQVDGTDAAKRASMVSFFPRKTLARPGDTLSFELDAIGEPHTVAFGTLVDEGLAALDKVAPKTLKEAFLGEPPEMFKLPSVFGPPPTQQPENQAAGQPCFLDSGEPPLADPCPTREQPAFDGKQSLYNSGWLSEEDPYTMTLADDIETGTYRFMCLIHRGAMNGEISVVGQDEARPGPEEVENKGKAELADALENLRPALEKAEMATPDTAVAGTGSGEAIFEFAMTFGPREASIKVGESMSWSLFLCHTLSFNPPAEAFGDLMRLPDGAVRLNPLAYAPSEAPVPPPISFDPNAPPIRFDAGSWDGTGFFNSGGICSLGQEDFVYKLAFSEPGTYQLRCLFHPFMQATIKVA